MKILINAVSVKVGGAWTYLSELARECVKHQEYEFIWYVSPGAEDVFRGSPKHFHVITTSAGALPTLKRLYWDQVTFRKIVADTSPDLVYSTGNFAMLFCPAKQVVLVTQPVPFSAIWLREIFRQKPLLSRLDARLRRRLMCLGAKKADIVMTPTQAMLDDLRRFVVLDSRKTLVNPFGVAPSGDCTISTVEAVRGDGGRCSHEVRLCYVSLYAEHKNLRTLLRAMPLINRSSPRRFVLKTTVNPGWEKASWTCTHREDRLLAENPDVAPWVEFVGPLSSQEVSELYRESDIFVFPSIAESFGLPMAEAMSFGLPIVAADTPVNREICGNAAVYFTPLDPDDLARALKRVSEDPALRWDLGSKGKRRAHEKLRWDLHVRRILALVEKRPYQVTVGRMKAKEAHCP